MALRKGQKELVEQYRGGYCAVPAIPGGGKTYCLTMWASKIISMGLHRPGKLLVVTYMNSAVNNFKKRISDELDIMGIRGDKDYHVSTIHGLCLQIVKEKPEHMMMSEQFDILDESGSYSRILNAVERWSRLNGDRLSYFLEDSQLVGGRAEKSLERWKERFCSIALSAIGDMKCRGIDAQMAKERSRGLHVNSMLKCIAEVYELYDNMLKMEGYVDFDDMLRNARRLLAEDQSILEKYRKMYSFVCEDEAQDSNFIQNEVLTLIANGNLLRVGDSNQAICSTFTSSDYRYFNDFCSLPEIRVYNITQSSRSTADIIDLANYFVSYIRDSHPLAECRNSLFPQYIEPVGEGDENPNPMVQGYGIKSGIFGSWDEEAGAVARQARFMCEKYPDKTMAILVANSWKMEDITRLLTANRIPFEQLDSNSNERNKPLKQLGRLVDFIAFPESGTRLADMFFQCFYEPPSDDGDRLFKSFLTKHPVEQLLYPSTQKISEGIPEEIKNLRQWKVFCERADIIRSILEYPVKPIEKLVLFLAEIMDFNREETAIAHKVAKDAGFMLEKEPGRTLSDIAALLLQERRNTFSYFTGVVWDLKGYRAKPGVVTVSTYHKSKGLEWDIVFLTGLSNEDFPVELSDRFRGEYWYLKHEYRNPQAFVTAEIEELAGQNSHADIFKESKLNTISERARLLYVGITRAREYLFLSGFHANKGKRNEVLPSKYLIELKKYMEGRLADER